MRNISVDKSNVSFTVTLEDYTLMVESWGDNSARVRVAPEHGMSEIESSKTGIMELDKNESTLETKIESTDDKVVLKSGDLKVIYNGEYLKFYNRDELILSEYSRQQSNVRRTIGIDEDVPYPESDSYSLNYSPYSFKKTLSGNYATELLFEGDVDEYIFGLGGYQETNLNKNLNYYELMHRNSQTSIPMYLSSKNYGFIWNSSSVGSVNLGGNIRKWTANEDDSIDYIITVGENPKQVSNQTSNMLGKPPMIESTLLGLWQSKLRYQTLDELKEVVDGYKERNITLSVIVIDYFHWPAQGDFKFDFNYWDGIKEYASTLKEEGTQVMVSLWPTVESESENSEFYESEKMLLSSTDGNDVIFNGAKILDFSNPSTREFVQELLKKNYQDNNINLFWADQAEPEMNKYSHAKYQNYEGNFAMNAAKYPYYYVKTINEILPNPGLPILIRSAWFNSQKYGALAWSGDIDSTFDSLRRQIQIALSMGVSGIPWSISDIAGFHSGDSESDLFKELMIRWFQFATFSPILRMHGDRQPHTPKIGKDGGGVRTSGGPNEIWSFGSTVEETLKKHIEIRDLIRPYLIQVFQEASEFGYPILRPLFFEFPDDSKAWNSEYHYLLGSDLLVCPIVDYQTTSLDIHLPEGNKWVSINDGLIYDGGQTITQEVSLSEIPLFYTKDSKFQNIFKKIYGK